VAGTLGTLKDTGFAQVVANVSTKVSCYNQKGGVSTAAKKSDGASTAMIAHARMLRTGIATTLLPQ
jgi:hypothetical protein